MRKQDSKPVRELAFAQAGVISRRQLLGLGLTRWQIKAQLRACRWKAHGRQTISTHTGELSAAAMRWYAVFEAGPRAVIDGVSALEVAGLTGWQSKKVRVSLPRGAPAVRRPGLMVRQTRRLRKDDVIQVGLPRVRPEIAAVRAALWAVTDRQAATLMAMTVQQRLTTAEAIGRALLDIKRHRRRRFLERIVLDLMGGAESMGELDFAVLCRRHGLPGPDRQAIRKTSKGNAYLDVFWLRFRLVVEVDGIHHIKAPAVVADALRQNNISLEADVVLRVPLLGLRVAEAEFMQQIRQGLVNGGWRSKAA